MHVAATANGAEWLLNNLRGLRARGYAVTALICGGQGDLAPKLEREGFPCLTCDLDLFSPLKPREMLRKILRLTLFLARHRFDIVQYYLFPSTVLSRIAAWIADVPLRFSMSTGPFPLEAPLSNKIERSTTWMDSRIIATCEYTRQLYHAMGVAPDRVGIAYFGRDPSYFDPASTDGRNLRDSLGIGPDTPVVGMVSHFYGPLSSGSWTPPHLQNRPAKGHETFIQAARLVLEKRPDASFLLVGRGWGKVGEAYLNQLRSKVKQQGLDQAIRFVGYQDDIPGVLAAFDIATYCSLNDNLGGTSEALFMARPTVASAVGGMVDTVRHEETGLLVPPDDPAALSSAILALLADPEKARQLGRNGRELMLRHFTLSATIDYLHDLYQSSARSLLKRKWWRSHSPQAHRYRPHVVLLRLAAAAILLVGHLLSRHGSRWVLSLRRSAARAINPARVFLNKLTLAFSPFRRGLPCNLSVSKQRLQRLGKAIADLAPLLVPGIVAFVLVPAPWNLLVPGLAILLLPLARFFIAGPPMTLARLLSKRIMDIILATAGMAALSPAWLVIAIDNLVRSRGPLLLREEKVGRFESAIRVFRFAARSPGTNGSTVGRTDSPCDSSGVRIGKPLPRLGLEESPRLINVLLGSMSFVGPLPMSFRQIENMAVGQRRRWMVKPGLVSWALVRTRDQPSREQQLELDNWYADHWTFWLDLYALCRAVVLLYPRKRAGPR